MHTKDPHVGHQKLYDEITGVLGRAELTGISGIEQIALLSQIIGRKISDLDPNLYEVAEVMQSVARNIASGNADESSRLLTGLPGGRPI
jgi:hypothetical protein